MNITGKGMKFRWLNNAGFEMELSSGKHLLVDPWLDEAQIYPISIDEIERADYVLRHRFLQGIWQGADRVLSVCPAVLLLRLHYSSGAVYPGRVRRNLEYP